MIKRLECDTFITESLTSIIRETQDSWKRVRQNSFTLQDFLENDKPPVNNIEVDGSNNFYHLPMDLIDDRLMLIEDYMGCKNSNCVVYPPNTIMRWHTNTNNPGLRTYYSFGLKKSIFRYIDENGNTIDDYDNVGWTVRQFLVDENNPFWHTIWSEGIRFAFGFNETKNIS